MANRAGRELDVPLHELHNVAFREHRAVPGHPSHAIVTSRATVAPAYGPWWLPIIASPTP